MENDDELIANFANISADIILGKNAQIHLPVINQSIENLNIRIEHEFSMGNEPVTFIKLGYMLYKLKDDAEKLISK